MSTVGTSDSELPPYQYEGLRDTEFRLLRITTSDTQISCSLHAHDLDHAPEYYALSYCWGSGKPSYDISCNGQKLGVTENLQSGLLALSSQFGDTLFWIDAISINQSDDAEKAVQVPRMAEIYSTAERVVVWMGLAADDSGLFMSSIKDLNEAFSKIARLETVNQHTLVTYGLPPISDPVWPAMVKFMVHDWFTRLWVLQEVVLAKEILVLCGNFLVQFDEFNRFFGYSRKVDVLTNLAYELTKHIPDSDSDRHTGLTAFGTVHILRELRRIQTEVVLSPLLLISRQKMVTENVDKVYGIMGLMGQRLRSKIRVDYSPENRREFWRLYVDVCMLALEEDGFGILDMLATPSRHSALPSWCPDLRYNVGVGGPGGAFNASFVTHPHAQIPKPVERIAGSNEIIWRGMEMDSIQHIVKLEFDARGLSPSEEAKILLNLEAQCFELSREIYKSDQDVPQEHIMTLTTSKDVDGNLYDAQQAVTDYHNMRAWYQDVIAANLRDDQPQHFDVMVSAERYKTRMMYAWNKASFFTTHRGHIGIAPASIRTKDSVCIFFTASSPHILRFDQTRNMYTFVGSAYVHGLMDGGAFNAADPLKNYKSFVVC